MQFIVIVKLPGDPQPLAAIPVAAVSAEALLSQLEAVKPDVQPSAPTAQQQKLSRADKQLQWSQRVNAWDWSPWGSGAAFASKYGITTGMASILRRRYLKNDPTLPPLINSKLQ